MFLISICSISIDASASTRISINNTSKIEHISKSCLVIQGKALKKLSSFIKTRNNGPEKI